MLVRPNLHESPNRNFWQRQWAEGREVYQYGQGGGEVVQK